MLAFEGKKDSLRFATFSSPLTGQGKFPWMHETIFYIGKHPRSGKSGIIMAERTTTDKYNPTPIFNNLDQERFFLLAEDVAYLKFRYYQVRKLSPSEVKLQEDKSIKYESQWVTSVKQNSFTTKFDELTKEQQARLNFEKNNKMTLPRAVEISLGLREPSKQSPNGESRVVFSPPIIIPLYSGMRFALPLKSDENI